ncbi:DUF6325 family protein [Salsipaludibacter albus]|uniref:DUF6325 family protein n=1 Tax=Salsipaludibacter albus TaxID=2849650 RepID=UPI001EE3A5BB|nr:DUF6325 family protein [Salsipaludibacter albus]MBY5162712.1 hypothetical protein [Salsipaludibacter albus]
MAFGPVEVLVLAFPGNQFRGEIIPELQRLVAADVIGIVDGVFVIADEDGTIEGFELDALEGDAAEALAGLDSRVAGLLSEDDVLELAAGLEPNSSAAILVFEHRWATSLQTAVRNAGGELVADVRIPADVVDTVAAGIQD